MSREYTLGPEASEGEKTAANQRDRLLAALQPFLVDLGTGCGYEALENIRETTEEIQGELGR